MFKRTSIHLFACLLLLAAVARAQDAMSFKAAATTKFGAHPALPACATIAVMDGDPAKPGSFIALKATAGCVIPWHWHTANERLVIVSGSAHAEMKGMAATSLHAGDFILLPGKGIHQFHAVTSVLLYDISDAPFDIHYVDASGTEIPPSTANKPKLMPVKSAK